MALNTMDVTKTQKNPSRIYFGLAVPAAGAEVTIGADGTPDATENPNAKQVGLTEAGAVAAITKTLTQEYFDEFKQPLEESVDQVNMEIRCRATQILDIDLMTAVTVGVGTAQTVTGKKKLKIGEGALSYSGIACIAPTKADATKFVVFHIYKGFQTNNIEVALSRQTRAGMDLVFRGVAITSRAADDQLGSIWWQTA